MDMDMDIPQPDELEWLEANSHLQEEDYFDEPEPYPEENEGEPPQPQQQQVVSKPLLVIPAKLTIPPNPKLPPLADPNSISKTQINGQKRPQSDRPDALPDQLDGKRRRNDKVGSENDKDWLRFSPTRETEQTHVEETRRRNGNVGTENDEEWLQYSTIIETEQTHVEEKRRRNGNVGTENDEVWLRYSPTRETEQTHREDPAIVPEEKIVARFASEIDGDCIPVTGFNGDRVYAKINRVERKDRFKKLDVQAHSSGGLILEPINILLQRVEQDAFTKALRASSEDHNDEILPQTSAVNEQLWVDKYAPNSFTELLSDEQTNREVLLWLKQWDSCVFGSEIRSTTEDVLASLRRHSSLHQKPCNRSFIRKNEGPRFGKENFTYSTNLIQDSTTSRGIQELWNSKSRLIGPPEQKILLLCGSPGLGKTTLAHVAAKHCGYRVVEINASDDRSSSTIESKIQDAVQMNSVIADSKPKCLVIDEIDGALGDGKGAVEVILKMVSADKKSDIGGENVADKQSGSLSSKKRGRAASLSRPVICICNDLYTPALRQLRQIAKIHIFVQPTVSRVVSRLKYICNKEGLRTSSIALTSLAEYTGCDIRSCLNTLQFLNKKKAALNPLEISSQVVGRKDMSRSVFDIWKEIFQKRKMRREKNLDNSCSRTSNEFNSLHSLITSRGDNDLILDGIHENILHLRYHDPVMHKTVKCLNSLGVSDLIQQYVMRTQQLPLFVYQPPIAITIHGVIAQVEKANIEWPKSSQRCRMMLMEKKEIFRSWHYKIMPYISRHLSTKSFVEDLVSPLLHILSPPTMRPVAFHLLSEKEKTDLAQVVGAMVSYSVTYKNARANPLLGTMRDEAALDSSTLSFDPPISDFINFKGHTSGHYVLSLAVKQVLVHEVEKQRILQVSMGRSVHLADECTKGNQAMACEKNNRAQFAKLDYAACFEKNMDKAKAEISMKQTKTLTSNTASALDSNKSASTSVKLKSPEDTRKTSGGSSSFFDRFRKLSSKGSKKTNEIQLQKAATFERDSHPVLFKFNEGYTNAVKRPVRIRELLL